MAENDNNTNLGGTVTHQVDYDEEAFRSIIRQEIQAADTGGSSDGDGDGLIGKVKSRVDALEKATESHGKQLDEASNQIASVRGRLDALENADGGGSGGETPGVDLPDGGSLADKIREVMVAEYGDDLQSALGRIMLPSRKLGPSPNGSYHEASMWGVDFEVERAAHLGAANVDAAEAGTFTAVLGEYDGDAGFTEVASKDIEVEQGVNTVSLDFEVPQAGRYLLTRNGNFPLRRGEWGGWDSQSRGGVTLNGGAKPGDYDDNTYYYYYFGLQIAAAADAH